MNIINFLPHRTKIGLYYNVVKLDGFLDDLATLLAHEIGGEKDSSWIDFLKEPTYQEMDGNEVTLEKDGKDVYISNQFCNDLDGNYNKLKISISELLKIIETWEVLLNKKSEKISLIYKNGKFELIEG